MKLVVEPKPNTQDIYVATKLGRLDIADFLKMAIARDTRSETRLCADANIDHATIYNLLRHKTRGSALRATLILLDILGYDVMLVKREKHEV